MMAHFDEKINSIREGIRKADKDSKFLGQGSVFHAEMSDRYHRLAVVLDETAEKFVEKPEPPQANDTF
jgi:hypothetical protein